MSSGGLTLDADNNASNPTATFTLSGTPNGTSNPLISATSLVVNATGKTNVVISGSPAAGTYDLIGYTGSTTFGNFNTTVTGPAGFAYMLVNGTNQIDLSVVSNATTNFTSSTGSSVYGTPVNFTFTVTGSSPNTPTGTVTLYDGSTPLSRWER